jgi:SAM-dependent methyltransferase
VLLPPKAKAKTKQRAFDRCPLPLLSPETVRRSTIAVLDFGCGDGALLRSIRAGCFPNKSWDLRCIEPFPVGAPPGQDYAYVLPGEIPPASVDVAYAHHSLHHAGDVESNVALLCSRLRPGGVLQIKEHDCGPEDPFRANLMTLHYIYLVLEGTTVTSDLGTAYRSMHDWIRLVKRQPGIERVSVQPPRREGGGGLRTFVLRAYKNTRAPISKRSKRSTGK